MTTRLIGIALLCLLTFKTVSAQEITVNLCNIAKIPKPIVQQAEIEASYVFEKIGVIVKWAGCNGNNPNFIMRVQPTSRTIIPQNVALDVMGMAYLDNDGTGYMADVYFNAIHKYAESSNYNTEDYQVLGYAMTHELGHLLIGPGHSLEGIMKTGWKKNELEEISQRRMRFDKSATKIIQHRLSHASAKTLQRY